MDAFMPLAFVLGVVAGAAAVWLFRVSRQTTTPSRKRYGLTVAAVSAVASIALTVVVGYVVVRWKFRVRAVTKVSVKQAVADFRAAGDVTPGNVVGGPTPGVYRFKGSGFYELTVPVVGNDRRDLLAQIPAALVHTGACWELTIRFFKQHSWTAHYCKDAAGTIAMRFWRGGNTYFGRTVSWSYACAPADIVRPNARPGETWRQTCRSRASGADSSPPKHAQITFVGAETVDVGGEKIRARHMRRTIKTSGDQAGATERHLWFSEDTGLLVRLTETSNSKGMATFRSQWQVVLASVTPTK